MCGKLMRIRNWLKLLKIENDGTVRNIVFVSDDCLGLPSQKDTAMAVTLVRHTTVCIKSLAVGLGDHDTKSYNQCPYSVRHRYSLVDLYTYPFRQKSGDRNG